MRARPPLGAVLSIGELHMSFGFTLRFGRTFITIDDLGFYAGWRGREVAWTPGFGWTLD